MGEARGVAEAVAVAAAAADQAHFLPGRGT